MVIQAKDGDLAEGIVAFHADDNQLAIGFPGKIIVWSLVKGKYLFLTQRVTRGVCSSQCIPIRSSVDCSRLKISSSGGSYPGQDICTPISSTARLVALSS